MATSKQQRIGILIIMIVMVVGTLGGFVAMIFANKNYATEQAAYEKLQKEYEEKNKAYEAKVAAQTKELSDKYYPILSQYTDRVTAFDRDSVTALLSEDLLVGDGEEITGTTKFAAYYILWGPEGKAIEQSIDTAKSQLNAPMPVETGLDNAALIDGWKEGMKGMKIGGVRELSIPSDKAYGEAGSKDSNGKEKIAPNTPLKFIVMAIPMPETFEQPDTTALFEAYQKLNQQ